MNKLQLLKSVVVKAEKAKLNAWRAAECAGQSLSKEEEEAIYEANVKIELQTLEKAMLLMPRLDALLEKHNISQTLEKVKENLYWITLRPSDEHKDRFLEFKKYCEEKYFTRQMFVSCTWVWEQKGEDMNTMGRGYHVHILAQLTTSTEKGHCIRNTKSTFNKFLNGDCPDAFVDVKKVSTILMKANLLHYMAGIKNSTAEVNKEASCKMDTVFRNHYELQDVYSNDAPIQDQIRGIILDSKKNELKN
jgi:hypothetical protein